MSYLNFKKFNFYKMAFHEGTSKWMAFLSGQRSTHWLGDMTVAIALGTVLKTCGYCLLGRIFVQIKCQDCPSPPFQISFFFFFFFLVLCSLTDSFSLTR